MEQSLKNKLTYRAQVIELLTAYSDFLEESGYMDTDWRSEEPKAIDEFLKENKNKKSVINYCYHPIYTTGSAMDPSKCVICGEKKNNLTH